MVLKLGLTRQKQCNKMAAEAFYLPVFTLVSVAVSFIAVSIVVSKVHAIGFLASGDRGDWVVNLTASSSDPASIDEGMSNKVVYINLDAYMAAWENGFPFLLFDPGNVVEGTSITIFNSPASMIGSFVRISYINSPGIEPGGNSNLCYQNSQANASGQCPCPVPGPGPDDHTTNWCLTHCGNKSTGLCTECKCDSICTPQNPIALNAVLGRGQGVTLMVQRRIPNVNIVQEGGTCFYYDITPPEVQPKDWVAVKYYSPSIKTQCSTYNGFSPSAGTPVLNLCQNYLLGENSIFSDNIPSALIYNGNNDGTTNPWRQNGEGPPFNSQSSYPLPNPYTAQNNPTWQECYQVDCGCSTGSGLWCHS